MSAPPVDHEPLVLLRGVTKVYDMGETQVHALRGVDLRIDRGEFVAIIGQSGSGKSTLMHLIGCLDTPTEGEVFIGGEDVSTYSESDLAQIRNETVGFMFQTFNLMSRVNLMGNTSLPLTYAGVSPRVRRQRARRMLEQVGLGDRIHHRPNQLSGGQCQRAAIARALVTEPDLILADEPTGNLDSESGAAILAMLQDLHRQGHTVVLVTHETRIAEAALRQVRILDGRVVEDSGSAFAPIPPGNPLETPAMNTDPAPTSPTPDTPPSRAPRRRRRRRGWRRFLKWFVVLAVLLSMGGCLRTILMSRKSAAEEPLKEPIHLEKGAVEERLLETGTVELRTTIEVKSTMSGKVKELLVEEGDAVESDQILAVIQPDPNEILRLYQKRAAVESRWIQLQETARELERSKQLFERGVLPGDQFEKIEDAYKSAQTSYQLAQLELEALEKEINPGTAGAAALAANPADPTEPGVDSVLNTLTDIRVRSPITGLVIKRPVEVGELVISGTATTISGTTLVELGDPAEAIIRAAVNEVDIGKVKVGQPVDVTLSAYEDETRKARVSRISPIGAKPQGSSVVSFNVEVVLDELDQMVMPGMSCDLDIVVDAREETSYLPRNAIFQELEKKDEESPLPGKETEERRGGIFGGPRFAAEEDLDEERKYLDYVWVRKGEEDWEKRQVTLGLKGDKRAEILSGLDEEDLVYPEAERLRWILEERERLAKKKSRWPWSRGKAEADTEEAAADAGAEEGTPAPAGPAGGTEDAAESAAEDAGDDEGEVGAPSEAVEGDPA